MISHRNVIANVLQITAAEKSYRASRTSPGSKSQHTEVALGLLPQSHIYSLVVICHAGPYRGDQVIVLPKFELKSYLTAIEKFKISVLLLVRDTPLYVRRISDAYTLRRSLPSSSPCSGTLKSVRNTI